MAYIPPIGSVAAWLQSDNASVITKWQDSSVLSIPVGSTITVSQGSVATVIIGGSIAASFIPPANQSISGTVNVGNFPTTQNVSGSVVATQGTSPWVVAPNNSSIISVPVGSTISYIQNSVATVIIGGSISATFTPPANQSVSGTVQTDVRASVAVVIIGGSVATATTNSSVMLLNSTNVIGSVAVLQGTSPWTIVNPAGSVTAVAIVSGSVTVATGNSSVQLLGGVATIGSVTALQGTNPYVMTGSVQGTMSVLGTVPVTQSTSPWIITGSIQGGGAGTQYIENAITPSVTGNAIMFKSNISSSIVSVVTPSTPLPIQGSVSGTVNLGIGTAQIGSVVLSGGVNAIGSVAALQGTNPWFMVAPAGSVQAVRTDNASVITVNQSSSVIAVVTGSVTLASSVITVPTGSTITIQQANSIVGTYAEDAGSATGDKGLFVLGVRSDTLASLVSADLDYGAFVQDSAGRIIIKPFASEDATIISYTGSVVSGSVTLIQASAVGKRSYITDIAVANTGATTTLVTFQGGDTSIVGYTIAPTAGGSNLPGLAIPWKTNPSQDLAFKMSPSTSVLYLTIKGYQAP